MAELRFGDMFERRQHRFFDELIEEFQIFAAVIEHVANRVFQKLLGQLHVVFELVEGHLRLDHPELGQVARRVAVLGAKGWAEGVNLRERQGEDFSFELAADGEKSRLAEKILLPVDFAVGRARRLLQVQRRHAEHLTGAFAVRRRDDRRLHVNKVALLKETCGSRGSARCARERRRRRCCCARAGERSRGETPACGLFFAAGRWRHRRCRRFQSRATFNSTACPLAGDSTSMPVAARLLPVVICLRVSSGIAPASTTSCMLLKREPSFSSMKVIPLESRRERTQPRRVISLPTDRLKACLTETKRDAICAKYRKSARNVNRGFAYDHIFSPTSSVILCYFPNAPIRDVAGLILVGFRRHFRPYIDLVF